MASHLNMKPSECISQLKNDLKTCEWYKLHINWSPDEVVNEFIIVWICAIKEAGYQLGTSPCLQQRVTSKLLMVKKTPEKLENDLKNDFCFWILNSEWNYMSAEGSINLMNWKKKQFTFRIRCLHQINVYCKQHSY